MDVVLLLEAEERAAKALKEQLSSKSCEVVYVREIVEAKKQLAYIEPSLFLVDLHRMPMEFLEFYQWVIETPRLQDIPRVFLAGKTTPLIEALRLQSHDTFLQKPIQLEEFFEAIELALKNRSSDEEPEENRFSDHAERQLQSFVNRQIGSAIVKHEIGRGGMGAVFVGYQEALARKVAIKVMLPELIKDEAAVGRFRREALAIARIKSPHIVQVFDAGLTPEGVFFIIMEFLEGGTVSDQLRVRGSFRPAKALNIVLQTARGLLAAHEQGLIHRDIKPSNLMIAPSGHITITDFGLVRENQQDLQHTQTGVVVGTPHYLSPEQAYGKSITTLSDMYSLGIVFYELLTGQVPFNSNNLTQVLVSHVCDPLPDPRTIVSGIPAQLVSILNRMVEKEPKARFADCRELISSLESIGMAPTFESIETAPLRPGGNTPDWLKPSIDGELLLQKRPLDVSMVERLSVLKKVSISQFNQDTLEGMVTINEFGALEKKDGSFDEGWVSLLLTLVGHATQIRSAVDGDAWQHSLLEVEGKIMSIFPKESGTCAMLFPLGSERSSMSLDSLNRPQTRISQSGLAPLEQLASIAGVLGAFFFDENGDLLAWQSIEETGVAKFEMGLLPLVHLFVSIPERFIGLDCWFASSRVMVWQIGRRLLFLHTESNINRSMLMVMLRRQVQTLLSLPPKQQEPHSHSQSLTQSFPSGLLPRVGSQDPSDSFPTFETSTPPPILPPNVSPHSAELGELLSTDVLKMLQVEYAKSIGPVAKVAMNKQIKKMGYSRKAFPARQGRKLVEGLARRLEPTKRPQFLELGLNLLTEHGSTKR